MIWPLVWRSRYDALQVQLDLIKAQQLLLVDREAYEAVKDERDRLREQNDRFWDHSKRMDRVDHGLTEEERKERKELGDMPFEMQRHFAKWPPAIRRHQTDVAWARRKNGESWEDLWAEVQAKHNAREND